MARKVLAAFLATLMLPVLQAGAAAPLIEPKTPRAMTEDDMAEIVDFVVGNAVFSLYHQAGHMLMQRYGAAPKGVGNAERAADLFAVATLLDPRSGAGDQTLVDAIDSWKLARSDTLAIAAPAAEDADPHAIDEPRADAIVCDIVGADPDGFADVAEAAGLDVTGRRACAATWKRDHAAITTALRSVPVSGASPAALATDYEAAGDAESAVATILEDNRVLEEVAERLAERFAFADPPALVARNCGQATTRFDAKANELVFCYELAAAHARLIMHDIERRN